jgi:hypothetical protein
MDLLPVENKIYEIRGYRVMLDFDLAEIYGIENKYLKRAVRSNIKRFEGDDFMFELTKDELSGYNSGTLNKSRVGDFEVQKLHLKQRGGIRYLPFAFTELGVAMLSSVLNSDTAIETNRKIMRAFVAVRQLILNQPAGETKEWQSEIQELKQYIEEVFTDYNDINEDTRLQLEQINLTLAEMQVRNRLLDKPRRKIGFFTEQQRENNEDVIE